MKAAILTLLACVAAAQTCTAAAAAFFPTRVFVVRVDWQYPQSLPPRFRNHCGTEYWTGRAYCADRCGTDYQVFYCSEGSFGCCHLGRGYCDFHGVLRCSP